MAYLKFLNAADELSLRGSFDPLRNVRNVSYYPAAAGFLRVLGELRDDGAIAADRPRPRVHTLSFDVLIPEKASVEVLLEKIRQQTTGL